MLRLDDDAGILAGHTCAGRSAGHSPLVIRFYRAERGLLGCALGECGHEASCKEYVTVRVATKVLAWMSLITEIIIVGTGGSVRLTASGLGCPTWPQCTPGSLIPTPELGIHAIIEFTNRMMSGVVAIVALMTFLFLVRTRKTRPELFWLSFALGVLVLVQAGIGGVTVLSDLQSYVVGLHFVLSAIMVALAAALVWFLYRGDGSGVRSPVWMVRLVSATAVVIGITVFVGVLTTGAGPHAGDIDAPRNGLDTAALEHFHAWPAYAAFALTLAVLVTAWRGGFTSTAKYAVALLGIELVQIAVGLYQARAGIPPLAVGIHMVLACILIAAMTAVALSVIRPKTATVL